MASTVGPEHYNGGGPDVLADSPTDWPERVADTLATFRTSDGGYAKATGSASGSTYHTFLVGLCFQLLGRPLPRPEEVARFDAASHRSSQKRRHSGPECDKPCAAR